jgi:uncharacterized protein
MPPPIPRVHRSRFRTFFPALARAAVTILILLGAPVAAGAAAPEPSREEVSFRGSDGVALNGTVIVPAGPSEHPAMVMVGGAGPTTRDELEAEAEAFARRGVLVLIYDKRTAGSPWCRETSRCCRTTRSPASAS